MVRGAFSIPLGARGRFSNRLSSEPDSAAPLREFIGGEEHHLLTVAVESVLGGETRFSPLLISGPLGSGKTHLSEGLANRWSAERSDDVRLVSGSDFARACAEAVETDSVREWREEIDAARLLILDDLQELGPKTYAQQELTLLLDRGAGRRTVWVTANSPPTAISGLSAALASRLADGLQIPLPTPAPGTRRLMARRLAEHQGLELPERVLDRLVADSPSCPQSFPQIRRCLLALEQAALRRNQPADAQLAEWLIEQQAWRSDRPTLRSITKTVARHFATAVADLRGPRRTQRLVRARGVAMLLARTLTADSLHEIGRHFGGRDHTTVLHACRRTEELRTTDPAIAMAWEELTSRFG